MAIAHDYLTQRGGAERVVLALTRIFPDAPVYTTLYEPGSTYPEFADVDVRTSWLNRVGVLRRRHRAALPLLPWASSSIRIDADVVVASSSGWAHGFRTPGRKLVYCYSPARWLYEPDSYLGDSGSPVVSAALRVLTPGLRAWDKRAAASADKYLAISTITHDRIVRSYGLDAAIVAAPHSVSGAALQQRTPLPGVPADGYFLVVSRLLPYKNVREVIQAFADRPSLRLVVIGAGPQRGELETLAGPNVTFLQGLTDEEMTAAYQGCTALVAASHEDFGLTPLEAAAHGKPSVVLRWGGFLDTVVEGRTGVFFDEARPDLIGAALDEVARTSWDEDELRRQAVEFGEAVFAARIRREVDELLADEQPEAPGQGGCPT